jgi:hypothetical protein
MPPRPGLNFRVGVTGTRDFSAADIDYLRGQIRQLLQFIRGEVSRLARSAEAEEVYQPESDDTIKPILTLISPLAEGADRLVAEIALAEGYALHVPMPFFQEEYEKDFNDDSSRAEFRALLARAGPNKLEFDGGRVAEEGRSYEAVGRFVARNCDLMIALWDGEPARGRGGTADIVRFAANLGLPVWWVHIRERQPPIWIERIDDLWETRTSSEGDGATCLLRGYLARITAPPDDASPPSRLMFERLAERTRQSGINPLRSYFAQTAPPRRWPWRIHGWLMRIAARGAGSPWSPPHEPTDADALYWYRRYAAADTLSAAFGMRYRSVYTWVLLLGALALTAGSLSLALHGIRREVTAVELAMLLAIAALVFANHLRNWHPRWIDYRLLAELCRKQQALAPLGWSLPLSTIDPLATSHEELPSSVAPERAAWVAWLFAAYVRAAPLACGRLTPDRLAGIRDEIRKDLILDQLKYHEDRARQYGIAAHTFALWGEFFFLLVIVLIAVKLLLLLVVKTDVVATVVIELLAVILPALAAGAVGFRSYAELQALAEQSRGMAERMQRTQASLGKLACHRPLSSQHLAVQVYDVATAMLQDIEGWASLFRVKTVEAG